MPIVQADIPNWASPTQMATLRKGLRGCIERTWAREHIWIAVRGMSVEPNETTVILTVDLRDGRGEEKQRTQALFDEALLLCNRVLGTTGEHLILLVRKFAHEECVSGGSELPPLAQLTPELTAAESKQGNLVG